jgi:hypothetical protein
MIFAGRFIYHLTGGTAAPANRRESAGGVDDESTAEQYRTIPYYVISAAADMRRVP